MYDFTIDNLVIWGIWGVVGCIPFGIICGLHTVEERDIGVFGCLIAALTAIPLIGGIIALLTAGVWALARWIAC